MSAQVQSLPLSAAQQGIWLGQQRKLNSPMYNAAEYIILEGGLDLKKFTQAVDYSTQRCVAFLQSFSTKEGRPVQQFNSHTGTLELIDLSTTHNEDGAMSEAIHYMHSDLKQAVDLQSDPLYRQILFKVGEKKHIWYIRIHHICADGYAFSLFMEKVVSAYNVAPSQLNNNADQKEAFRKVIEEDQNYHSSKAFVKDREYWLQKLRSFREVPSLSSDNAPPDDEHLRESSQLNAEDFATLKAMAYAQGLNWGDYLIASVATLVRQRSGSTQLCLGIPVMNRMGSSSLRVPAMVMNIVALPLVISHADSYNDIADQISTQLRESKRHHRYRYEQLAADLKSSHQKIFGPVVNIMPFDRTLAFSNINATPANLSAGPVEDISFAFVPSSSGELTITIDANPKRYSKDQLYYIHCHLSNLIHCIHADRQSMIPALPLSRMSGPALPEPVPPVHHLIQQQIQRTPQREAIRDGIRAVTYQELGKQAAELAHNVIERYSEPGNYVALALPRSTNGILYMLACLLSNRGFVFIDPDAPQTRNYKIISDAKPSLLVSTDNHMHYCNQLLENVQHVTIYNQDYFSFTHDDIEHEVEHYWKDNAVYPRLHARPAYLIYTSGSTGNPKGVVINQQSLAEFVAANQQSYAINAEDTVLQFAPFHFDACIEEIFISLCHGACLHLRDESMLNSMKSFVDKCHAWNITVLDLPTAFWHELVNACHSQSVTLPKSIRKVIIGGEAAQQTKINQWLELYGARIDLFNTYGPSEATVIACSACINDHNPELSIGRPIAGREAIVVDKQLRPVARGEQGELLLLGAGLADGYLNLPIQTDSAFVSIKDADNGKLRRAYRTGDCVFINRHGSLSFIGRSDDQIKVSGYRIEPLEIEHALLKISGITDATVCTEHSTDQNALITAHIVSDFVWDSRKLRKALSQYLPTPLLPNSVFVHAKLPKTATGKIDRKALSKQCHNNAPAKSSDQKRFGTSSEQEFTPTQTAISDIWKQVLGQSNFSLDDDFFSLGGQSLQTIQIASRLSSALATEVSVADIFENPSIRQLSEHLSDTENKQQSDILESIQNDSDHFSRTLTEYFNGNASASTDLKKAILLTGANGYLGTHLIEQLLQRSEADIYCMVRANTVHEATQRLADALIEQGLGSSLGQLRKRLKVIACNLEEPQFGLSDHDIQILSREIDCIIHNAANTSVLRDYHSLKKINAYAFAELIRFTKLKSASLHLVSTIAVLPTDAEDAVLPEGCVPSHSGLTDGYQQSKWLAEDMARSAREKGYPVNIYRLGRLTGARKQARVNPKDLVWNIIKTGWPVSALPALDIDEPWTPVDDIASFIAQTATGVARSDTFNCVSTTPINLQRVFSWVCELNPSIRLLPLSEWLQLIESRGHGDGHVMRSFFEKNKPSEVRGTPTVPPRIAQARFREELEYLGIDTPRVDKTLFTQYLNSAKSQSWFPKPAKENPVKKTKEFA